MNKSTTYVWFAKPNSDEYRDTSENYQKRDCFTLYAGITERSTNERFSGGYKFRYNTGVDYDLNCPVGGQYKIRKREINLVSTNKVDGVGTYECSFKEQLYINAVREAAVYLKKHNIKVKVGNVSNPVKEHFYDWFIKDCNKNNGGCTYDKKVCNKIIKEVMDYHKDNFLKSDEQNTAQLSEVTEKTYWLQKHTNAVNAIGETIEELIEENDRLKYENEQLKRENKAWKEKCEEKVKQINGILGKVFKRLDGKQSVEFIANDVTSIFFPKRREEVIRAMIPIMEAFNDKQ
tara:strand:+ start:4809 stop:5678 length:870 start_codon:yes stop_codon:yes gene_type:complete